MFNVVSWGQTGVHTGPQQCIPQTPQAFNMVANLNVILGGYDGVYGSIILGGCSERTLQTIQGFVHDYGGLLGARWMLGSQLLPLARTRFDLAQIGTFEAGLFPEVRSSHHILQALPI